MRLTIVSLALLLAVWALYPLAIAIVARRRPALRAAPPGFAPTVTCVVASRDAAALLRTRVANLLDAAYDPARLDVVVALDRAAAEAAPAELADLGPRVTVVEGDAPGGKGPGLNAAVRAARGEVLVFTDSQQRFAPDAVARLVELLHDPAVGAVSGLLELPGDRGGRSPAELYWSYERRLREHEARVHSTIGVTGAIYAMRRALWSPLPAGLILDDVFTPMRLVLDGYRIEFTPLARAVDARRTAAGQEYRRKVRTLTGVIQLCAWMPAVLAPVRNPVWLQFVFHKLLRLATPWLLIAAAVGVVWEIADRVAPRTFWLGTLVVVAAGLAASVLPIVGRRVRGLVVWGVTLQAAVVVATVNGLRGRWDVWQSPR